MNHFEQKSKIDVSATRLAAWHRRVGAFERLSPPWQKVTLESGGDVAEGSRAELRLHFGPIGQRWIARHENVQDTEFTDVQEAGPFAAWSHRHRFETLGESQSQLVDQIQFRLPLDPLSRFAVPLVRKQLGQTFRYRHRVTEHDLMRHEQYPEKPMRIVMSGASGLVGSALSAYLSTAGHDISVLTRPGKSSDRYASIPWSIKDRELDPEALEGVDAIIHLAGAPIAQRWNDSVKKEIRDSRVHGTSLLSDTILSLRNPPGVFISASAVGWYGATTDNQPRTESDPMGEGFLASVVRDWEAASEPARAVTRVANPRLGVVLSPQGGALAKMLPAFRFGMGGPIGSGKQWFPWVALDDLLAAFELVLHSPELSGPINFTSPDASQQREFANVLGRVLSRPSFLPLPRFAVELLFGEMGRETILEGVPVRPARLEESGFQFEFGNLEKALRHLLGRS